MLAPVDVVLRVVRVHYFIAQELNRAQVGFRQNVNGFLAVNDVAQLQAAADRVGAVLGF